MVNKKVMIIKQTDDEEFWIQLRNFLWNNAKELFHELDDRVYDVLEEKETEMRYRKENAR